MKKFLQKNLPGSIFDFFAFGTLLLFSFWLMFHTFNSGKGYLLISSKVWSDFAASIPLIRSFSFGSNFPPEYPLFPGEPIRYHFLFYFLVGMLEKVGVRIDWALNLPSALGLFLLLTMIYLLAKELFGDTRVAILSVVFFLFNGSLSFVRFFQKHPLSQHSLADILRATEFPAFAPWGQGDITAFWNLNIYTNQRHLALAFGLILLFSYTCVLLVKRPNAKQFLWAVVWGMLIGLLPFFHQPTLLIVAVIGGVYFVVYPKLRLFLLVIGSLAATIIVFQLPYLLHGRGVIAWYPGYLIHDPLSLPRFLTYWWQNLGLHSLLIPIGFLLAPTTVKKVLAPIIVIFAIANLFKFSVEVAGGHKFFNFVLILGQMLSAYILIRGFDTVTRLKQWPMRILLVAIGFLVFFFLIFSGVIDFFAVKNDTKGSIADIPNNEAATWILHNTPPDAVFLNSSYLFHPASLAGRKIFLGWPYFPWSLGFTENRLPLMKLMYESKDPIIFCASMKRAGIDYVTVEDTRGDPNLPTVDVTYFATRFIPVYSSSDPPFFIFTRQELCKSVPHLL